MATITWYAKDELVETAQSRVKPAGVVLDVGCGIRPQRLIPCMVHIGIEPYLPYIEAWHAAQGKPSQYVPLHGTWDAVMAHFPDQSVDTVMAGDVIEHLEKSAGWRFLSEAARLARQQIVLFTPLGYYPQHYELGKPDRWGMGGGYWQQHRSGWVPEEFDDAWDILACEQYHFEDENNQPVPIGFGAFYAIKTIS